MIPHDGIDRLVSRGSRRSFGSFLASVSSRLVHDMMQVLFAINKTYYVGDGNNLHYVKQFAIQPGDFAARVRAVLYTPQAGNALTVAV